MDVRCERCDARYAVDDGLVDEGGLAVRCSKCGHLFRVTRAPRGWRVRTRSGDVYPLSDASMLQRWVVEGRVSRDDEVSSDGGAWTKAGDLKDLAAFFALVEQARRADPVSAPSGAAPAERGRAAVTERALHDEPTVGVGLGDTPSETWEVPVGHPEASDEPAWAAGPPRKPVEPREPGRRPPAQRGSPWPWILLVLLLLGTAAGVLYLVRPDWLPLDSFGLGPLPVATAPGVSAPAVQPAAPSAVPPAATAPTAPALPPPPPAAVAPAAPAPSPTGGAAEGAPPQPGAPPLASKPAAAGPAAAPQPQPEEPKPTGPEAPSAPAPKPGVEAPHTEAPAPDARSEELPGAAAAAANAGPAEASPPPAAVAPEPTPPPQPEAHAPLPEAGAPATTPPLTGKSEKRPAPAADRRVSPAIRRTKVLLADARRMRDRGRSEAALDFYGQALQLEPNSADALAGRGLCYLDLSRYEPAEESFKAALQADANHAAALMGLAETYRYEGRRADAVTYYRRYLIAHPGGEDAAAARKAIQALEESQ